MENKKVKNAQCTEYAGIKFKSKFELATYKLLISAGFKPEYEPIHFSVWNGKKFSVPCYDLHVDRKLKKEVWGLNSYKPIDMKYTPDFIFYVHDSSKAEIMIIVEAKGFPTEKYYYQKKLFRSYLEEHYPNSMFFEVHNQKQVITAINIIKSIIK
jgi:hypothetical protein